jgi:hypothetical protein
MGGTGEPAAMVFALHTRNHKDVIEEVKAKEKRKMGEGEALRSGDPTGKLP